MARSGLSHAVAAHQTTRILDCLLDVVSYQGISDENAARYLDDTDELAHPA